MTRRARKAEQTLAIFRQPRAPASGVAEAGPLTGEVLDAPAGASAQAPGMDVERRAASTTDQVMRSWNVGIRDPNRQWQHERDLAVGRTRDIVNNTSWAAGAVDKLQSKIVGSRLRYSPRHEQMAELLGIPKDQASELASQIDREFRSWAYDPLNRCDWTRQQRFPDMVGTIVRHGLTDGDGLALMRWQEGGDPSTGWSWQTSMMVMDPDRLSNPAGMPPSATMYNGVETDAQGRIVAYHFRDAHPADVYAFASKMTHTRVPVRSRHGRPQVLHFRKIQRAGQMRGVSPFVACLRRFKILDRYTDAELQAATVGAMFAGFIRTPMSAEDAAAALALEPLKARKEFDAAYYSEMGMDPRLSDGSRIAKLAPGDEFELHQGTRQGGNYSAFVETSLRAIVAGLPGLTYEEFSSDYSRTNYSSARAALLVAWRDVLDQRDLAVATVCDPVLLCVIEEAIDAGRITPPEGCPELYENPAGWLAGRWIGPGRGYVDPVKEVQASERKIALGLSTLEDEVLETSGGDWQGNVGQQAWENMVRRENGLGPLPTTATMPGSPGQGQAAPDAPDDDEKPQGARQE